VNISSILDIIDGELKNSPSISFIYNIKTDSQKVIEGDLFLAKTQEDALNALKNGAFAIVYDFEMEVLDKEIAWIKVSSLEETLVKLFRFKFSTLNLEVFYCDKITFDLINIYKTTNKKVKLISRDLFESVKIIENVNEDEIFFCSNEELIKNIYPNYKTFSNENFTIDNLIEHSLFETSFSYKESYFNKLKIPSLYIKQFLSVLSFFDMNLDLQKLIKLTHFKPIFVDKYLNLIDFGKSNKFILCQENLELVIDEIKYLENKYKYGKIIVICPILIENLKQEQITVEKIEDLKNILKNRYFNAIYIVGFNKSKIEEILNLSSSNSLDLF